MQATILAEFPLLLHLIGDFPDSGSGGKEIEVLRGIFTTRHDLHISRYGYQYDNNHTSNILVVPTQDAQKSGRSVE